MRLHFYHPPGKAALFYLSAFEEHSGAMLCL